jgi:hypothetical protein
MTNGIMRDVAPMITPHPGPGPVWLPAPSQRGHGAGGLSTVHICTRAVGGRFFVVGGDPRDRDQGREVPKRGQITSFSRGSRRRMMNLLAMINMEALRLPWMITLTFPDAFPTDNPAVKVMLHRFALEFGRAFGKHPIIWRLEYARRKSGHHAGEWAPHFHLLVWGVHPTEGDLMWVSRVWFKIVGSEDEKHLHAGTRWEPIREWRHLVAYVSKYMAKVDVGSPVANPGRAWGVWNRELLPITLVSDEIPDDRFLAMRRVLRKYMERTRRRKVTHAGRWTGLTCYLLEHTGKRLVDWAWRGAWNDDDATERKARHRGHRRGPASRTDAERRMPSRMAERGGVGARGPTPGPSTLVSAFPD